MEEQEICIDLDDEVYIKRYGKTARIDNLYKVINYQAVGILKRAFKENQDLAKKTPEEQVKILTNLGELMAKENKKRNDRAKHRGNNVGRILKQSKGKKPLDF